MYSLKIITSPLFYNSSADHLAMGDNLWGNLFAADDPMTPQLEFRGGNGHTGKSVIIRSGAFLLYFSIFYNFRTSKKMVKHFFILLPFGNSLKNDIDSCIFYNWQSLRRRFFLIFKFFF